MSATFTSVFLELPLIPNEDADADLLETIEAQPNSQLDSLPGDAAPVDGLDVIASTFTPDAAATESSTPAGLIPSVDALAEAVTSNFQFYIPPEPSWGDFLAHTEFGERRRMPDLNNGLIARDIDTVNRVFQGPYNTGTVELVTVFVGIIPRGGLEYARCFVETVMISKFMFSYRNILWLLLQDNNIPCRFLDNISTENIGLYTSSSPQEFNSDFTSYHFGFTGAAWDATPRYATEDDPLVLQVHRTARRMIAGADTEAGAVLDNARTVVLYLSDQVRVGDWVSADRPLTIVHADVHEPYHPLH
jgi:hypothetical protein